MDFSVYNERLLEYLFLKSKNITIDKIIITGKPEELLYRALENDCLNQDQSEIWEDFIAHFEYDPTRKKDGFRDLFYRKEPSKVFPNYIPQVFISLIAASMCDETLGEGNFRNRLRDLLQLPIYYKFPSLVMLPVFWNCLREYLKSEHNVRLSLPDPGAETQIGYSKKIVFPSYKDSEKLVMFVKGLEDKGILEDLFSDRCLCLLKEEIYSSSRRYSESLKEELVNLLKIPIFESEKIYQTPLMNAIESIIDFECKIDTKALRERECLKLIYDQNCYFVQPLKKEVKNKLHFLDKVCGIPIESIFNGEELSDVPNYVQFEVSQGCLVFVENKNNCFTSMQSLPSFGKAVLFLRLDLYIKLEEIFQDKQNIMRIGEWFCIDKLDIEEFKNLVYPQNSNTENDFWNEIHYLKVFQRWQNDIILVNGLYLGMRKAHLFTPPIKPEVSASKKLKRFCVCNFNDMHNQCKCLMKLIPNGADRNIYVFPDICHINVKNKYEPTEIRIYDDSEKFVEISAYKCIPMSVIKGSSIKRPNSADGLQVENNNGEFQNISIKEIKGNTPLVDERELFTGSQKKENVVPFLQEILDTNTKSVNCNVPLLQIHSRLDTLPNELELDLYEVLVAKSLRKCGFSIDELDELLTAVYGTSTGIYYRRKLIFSLVENGVLDCYYNKEFAFRKFFPRKPQIYCVRDVKGKYVWRICGLLSQCQRELLQKRIERKNSNTMVCIPYLVNSSPSGIITIQSEDSEMFPEKICLEIGINKFSKCYKPIMSDIKSILSKSAPSIFTKNNKVKEQFWNHSLCRFMDGSNRGISPVSLVRRRIDPEVVRFHGCTEYELRWNNKKWTSLSYTWAMFMRVEQEMSFSKTKQTYICRYRLLDMPT